MIVLYHESRKRTSYTAKNKQVRNEEIEEIKWQSSWDKNAICQCTYPRGWMVRYTPGKFWKRESWSSARYPGHFLSIHTVTILKEIREGQRLSRLLKTFLIY